MKAKELKEWISQVPDSSILEVRDRYGDWAQRFEMRVTYQQLKAKEEVEAEEPES